MSVYVLGAGASANGGYPLASNLLQFLSAWFDEPHNLKDRRCVRVKQLRTKYPKTDNFEEILRLLGDETDDQVENGTDWFDRRYLREDLASSLRDCFIETARMKEAPAYEQFAEKIVQRGDTLITFNYDIALERALKVAGKWAVGTGYGFSLPFAPYDSPVKVLKLHGSVNWFHEVSGETFPPIVLWLDLLGYPNLKDPRIGGNFAVNNLGTLILPDPQKTFHWGALWKSLWDQAKGALQEASELVVLGYSMPQTDEAARKLLRQASLTAKISICSMGDSENIAEYFRRNDRPMLKARPRVRFEDYVSEKVDQDR